MAEISITTKLEELKVLFNQMKEVYYVSKVNSDLATLAAFDMELPVLSELHLIPELPMFPRSS